MSSEKKIKVKIKINKINPIVAKIFFRVGLAGSMLLGSSCTPEMLDAIVGTAQAPEIYPLPSDLASTRTTSEELHFEFTPTVENLATKEMTLMPEIEVASKTLTPTAKEREIPKPTATATEIPPVIETEVLEEKHIFLTEIIGYGDYQFDFEISLLNDDEIIKAPFEKFGVESISINEEKIGARELLAKGIIYSFVETYNLQNGTNVSMDEYMANPTNYPTMIKVLGDDGKQVIESITIDQIKKFDLRYTGGMGGELYMSCGSIPNFSGYRYEDGTFIMYIF